jgi:dihydrolipoamide dehydrogenase
MDVKDVVVIGGGPGGYVAAIRAAQLGGRVTLVEKDKLGGVCMNCGCVPTKVLMRGAELLHFIEESRHFGIRVEKVSLDIAELMAYKDLVVKTVGVGLIGLMKKNGIEVLNGKADLLSPTEVEIANEKGERVHCRARKVILATGSIPADLHLPGADKILTSDEALTFHEVPKSIVIVGAGAVGVEFGVIYAKLGSQVTILEMMPQIIPTEDRDVALALEECLKRYRIGIVTSAKVQRIEESGKGKRKVFASTPKGEETFEGDEILLAIGRKPNIEGLHLREIGLNLTSRGIEVNERMEANVSGIYAVGDVTGRQLMAHFASAQGVVAAENAMGKEASLEEHVVPRCIYTFPEVACVGLTENQAKERGYKTKIGRFPFEGNVKAAILREQVGFVKVVSEATYGEILGVHIIGPQATNLIGEVALAMQSEIFPENIGKTIHPHPTLSEAIMEACLDIERKALHIPPRAK